MSSFEVLVGSEKFNAAHFVAFSGFRERLHGHNYQVGVKLSGHSNVRRDGYVVDFGDVKKITRAVCKEKVHERLLCPMKSDVLKIAVDEATQQLTISCEDGSNFSLPAGDCALLPIRHSTAEEIAAFFFKELVIGFTLDYLKNRGVVAMEIIISEAPGQEAHFKAPIPSSVQELEALTPLAEAPHSGCLAVSADQSYSS
jgi:6-pyruvoyl-tetrahydropterin synthase